MLFSLLGRSFYYVLVDYPSNIVGLPRALLVKMVLFSVVVTVLPVLALATEPQDAVNCDIHNNACTQTILDTHVTLDINPKPVKAMVELRFRLSLTGKQPPEAPFIELGMPGMRMGPNRVELKSLGRGVYEGTGIIVRCPSGKRIWKATVTVPGVGAAGFIFDVIY